MTVFKIEEGFEFFGEVAGEGEEDGLEGKAGNEGKTGLSEEFPEREATEEGGSFEDDAVEKVGEERGTQGAEPEEIFDLGLADFGEEEVIETLATPEAEDAGEEDAASHAGNSDEGGVVGAGVAGEGGDNPEQNAGQEAESEAAACDGVGGAATVDFDKNIAEDVGDGEYDNAAVDRDAEEIPKFDGGEVGDDDHTAHSSAHSHEVTGGFKGDFCVLWSVFHKSILSL